MLLSELITAAQESLKFHGDRPVTVSGSEGDGGVATGEAIYITELNDSFRIDSNLSCESSP